MKILIASKFFYPRGGAEIVAIGTKQILEAKGHEVRIFAMEYPENIKIPDSKWYAPQVKFDGVFSAKIRGAMRTLGYAGAKQAAKRLLADFQPDVIHMHNVHSYLSPIIGEIAHNQGIRVIWTMHDYKLICPAYALRRPDGTICQECIANKNSLFRYRCLKNSLTATIVGKLEAKVWNPSRLINFTDTFITPSRFLGSKLIEGGFPSKKIVTLHNFIDPKKLAVFESKKLRKKGDGYFCYIGRLSDEKGIPTLLDGADKSGIRLKIAGNGPLLETMQKRYAHNPKIEFLGKLNAEDVVNLLSGAEAMVISSECYENNPLSVIESLCAGTPVIGASIGGIPELIKDTNGYLYPSGDANALATIFTNFNGERFDRKGIANKARKDFCVETHYRNLMKIYTGK